RSTFPYRPRFSGSSMWLSANLILDEPPLMVRMLGLAGFMGVFDSGPQSQRSQFCGSGFVICVKNASNPQTLRYLDEHRSIFNIDHLPGWHLGNVQRQPKDVRVRLAEVDKARGNKSIHKPVQFELSNPIRIQFTRFVADHNDLQSILCLELADQLDHPGIRFRLREHEAPELRACE